MRPETSTAFRSTEKELGRQIREAALDHQAFSMPVKVCVLGRCRATCCHDGVFLDSDQAGVLESVVASGELENYGFHRSNWTELRDGRVKTTTVAAAPGELADTFPAHFPKTRCVFLDLEHRCVLQRLATDQGRHPWWWKPISCWMHPLLLRRDADGRPVLGIAQGGSDPAAGEGSPGFGSCTPCGMPTPDGEPAWMVLRAELELLGRIGGRDLVAELSTNES